jgi:hypothetical protein
MTLDADITLIWMHRREFVIRTCPAYKMYKQVNIA